MPKRSIAFIALVVLMIISMQPVSAENIIEEKVLIFDHIGRDEGLKDVSISSMIQDRDGFIWLASQGGLFKYNGRDMVSYRTDPFQEDGIVHNLIQTMFYDEVEHVLWIGTYQGVSKLDISTNQFTNYTVEENGLSNNVVIAIEKDQDGAMWFGTMNGLNKLNEQTDKFELVEVEGEVVRSLLVDSKNRLLVGTYTGLYILEEESKVLELVPMDYPSLFVMVIEEFNEGIITIGMWDGGVLEVDMDFKMTRKRDYEDNRVYALNYTKDQTLWVGTWGGGLFVDTNKGITGYPGNGGDNDIGHSIVYSILEDTSGSVWVGTNGGGIYRTNSHKKNHLLLSNDPEDLASLDAGKINAIYKDQNNDLWIGVYNNGVNIYKGGNKPLKKYNTDNGLPNDQITEFIEYEDMFLLASGSGIIAYDAASEGFDLLGLLPEDTIVYAFEVDELNRLWVGTYLDGIYVFDDGLELIEHYTADSDQALSDNLVYDMLMDSKGRIWVCTNNGLDLFDSNSGNKITTFKKDGFRNSLPNNVVRTVCEAADGTIWIGLTGGGVSRYNETSKTFSSYTEEDGLSDNTVIGLVESYDHRIWAATHNGISIIDQDTEQIINLSTSDGIGGYNFTSSGHVSSDNKIYFGGTFGVSEFPPMENERTDRLPPLYITNMRVLNKEVEKGASTYNEGAYVFEASENFIAFEFNALDYLTTNQVRYSYHLEGVDEEFIESGNRNYVSYSNLKPGDYEFTVKAKTLQGEFTQPAVLSFSIKKPWYRSFYAIILYLLVIGFLVYSVFKIRESKVLAKVSTTDPLTGVYNRRYFDAMLEDYMQLSKRSKSYLSILMIDVDDFKLVNDQYGHCIGDEYLKGLAVDIRKQLPRKTDFCARYGGDEFVIVLYDTDEEGALKVVDKIMTSMTEFNLECQNKRVTIERSISVGVYTRNPDDDDGIADLVDRADQAMYKAKSHGKNQSILFREI